MGGVIAGIARHAVRRGQMETLSHVEVSVDRGIEGDCRGVVEPGGRGRRQVSLMELRDWDAAMRELGQSVPWQERRANLLVDGLDLPQRAGAMLRVGTVLIRVTGECDPCVRMEKVAVGLHAALKPDWRGGVLGRIIEGGHIAVGDAIGVEER